MTKAGPEPASFLFARADWQKEGLCWGAGPDLWYQERGESAEQAKAICRECPVRVPCLEMALEQHDKFGIWGGLAKADRTRLRRKRGMTAGHTTGTLSRETVFRLRVKFCEIANEFGSMEAQRRVAPEAGMKESAVLRMATGATYTEFGGPLWSTGRIKDEAAA